MILQRLPGVDRSPTAPEYQLLPNRYLYGTGQHKTQAYFTFEGTKKSQT